MASPPAEIDSIKRAAAAWISAHERGLTGAEQDRFFEWLAADPRHSEILSRQQSVMRDLRMLAHWRPEHAVSPNPDLLAAPKSRSRLRPLFWLAPLGIAAALAFAFFSTRPPVTVPETVGSIRRVLEDGSAIDLSPGAEVAVAYSADQRQVRLLHGKATFKVAKNPERPFTVTAAGITVRAVGTAFNVDLQSAAVAVVVTEGRVQVNRVNATREAPPEIPLLEAGHRAVVTLQPATPAAISVATSTELAALQSTRPQRLEFTDTPLAQVVIEFNAGNGTKLVLADPDLGSLPLGASLRSDNLEGFVHMLEANFNVKTERRGGMIILRR